MRVYTLHDFRIVSWSIICNDLKLCNVLLMIYVHIKHGPQKNPGRWESIWSKDSTRRLMKAMTTHRQEKLVLSCYKPSSSCKTWDNFLWLRGDWSIEHWRIYGIANVWIKHPFNFQFIWKLKIEFEHTKPILSFGKLNIFTQIPIFIIVILIWSQVFSTLYFKFIRNSFISI
jgi:hypothetical protein